MYCDALLTKGNEGAIYINQLSKALSKNLYLVHIRGLAELIPSHNGSGSLHTRVTVSRA